MSEPRADWIGRNRWDLVPSAGSSAETALAERMITLIQGDPALTARLHQASDVNASPQSLHHTIGIGLTDVAAGNHNHSPRLGTVTNAASPDSYSVQLDNDVVVRTQVPSTSSVIPVVGDRVRVALVGGDPEITGVIGRGLTRAANEALGSISETSTTYGGHTGGPEVTVPMVIGQTVKVTIQAHMSCNPGGAVALCVSYAISGADTVAATDGPGRLETNAAQGCTCSASSFYTAAHNGDHIFTVYSKIIGATTGSFNQRRILVEE